MAPDTFSSNVIHIVLLFANAVACVGGWVCVTNPPKVSAPEVPTRFALSDNAVGGISVKYI